MSTVLEIPQEELAQYRAMLADPVVRMRKQSGFVGWSKQHDVIRALYKHRLVTVRASHGVGKTAVAGAIVDDFMSLGPCRIVTTAPTWPQVRDQLWGEIHKRVEAAPIPWATKPTAARWKISNDWMALGLSTNRPERFQGHHGPRVLFVVDEASGVDDSIFDAGMGFLTGRNSYVLYIGNPNRTKGSFFQSHQEDSRFKRIHMNTFDCPDWTGEKVSAELADLLPNKWWHENIALPRVKGKVDHPFYRVRVLGEFADLVGRPYFDSAEIDKIQVLEPKRRGFFQGAPVRSGSVKWIEHASGEVKIWDAPKPGRKYLIFADVAGQVREEDWLSREEDDPGEGDDYCCADVIDLESGQQVAQMHARMDPDVYGEKLAQLGYVYCEDGNVDRPAWLGVESNGVGQATLATLKNHRYRRVWRRNKREMASQGKAAALGLVTTRDSKERILAYLTETVREAPARIRSERTRDELRVFEYKRNGYGGAASGYHDDAVIAFAGALEMRDQVLRRPGSDERRAA